MKVVDDLAHAARVTLEELQDLEIKRQLEPEAVVTLEDLVSDLVNAHQVLRLVVDGHCDDTGTDQYNQALSERRAEEVVGFLRGSGLQVRDVLVRGHGERIPWV